MDRRDFLKASILGSVLGPAFAASKITAASQQTDKPNIVIIYADDIAPTVPSQ